MLVRILLIVIAICHWSACIFWMVGNPESLITDLMPEAVYEAWAERKRAQRCSKMLKRIVSKEFLHVPHWTTISRPCKVSQKTFFRVDVRTLGPSQGTWRWIDRPTSESYIFCFYWTLGVMRSQPQAV